MDGISRVSIVTDKTEVALGFVQKVTDILRGREGAVAVQVIDASSPIRSRPSSGRATR
ncbi:hypothetical protein [Streptomyces sp. NPDC051109]|uniref:hypothetical protein n=1 Tax=Streptomyces sp. NPDC051109 TaxID=3365642 RepID=UPI0037B71A62